MNAVLISLAACFLSGMAIGIVIGRTMNLFASGGATQVNTHTPGVLDFPSNPVEGQTFYSSQGDWVWTGTYWKCERMEAT